VDRDVADGDNAVLLIVHCGRAGPTGVDPAPAALRDDLTVVQRDHGGGGLWAVIERPAAKKTLDGRRVTGL
jgi:hypothetical protein